MNILHLPGFSEPPLLLLLLVTEIIQEIFHSVSMLNVSEYRCLLLRKKDTPGLNFHGDRSGVLILYGVQLIFQIFNDARFLDVIFAV
jgi:hypothetical protein